MAVVPSGELERVGFTGTRNKPTYKQLGWIWAQLRERVEFHHGACVGSDEESHHAAMAAQSRVYVHPPTDERLMMPFDQLVWSWRPAKPYLDRNRDIVDETDRLIAIPDGPERWTGGTWYTVHYAEKLGRPVSICYPDGGVEHR